MSVLKFDGEDEVIDRANDTEFGLAAGVFTSRPAARPSVSSTELQAGTLLDQRLQSDAGGNAVRRLQAVRHRT
jgi:acyl-CoA reductase-like NAD-dependent aldehyde dehydrogenase